MQLLCFPVNSSWGTSIHVMKCFLKPSGKGVCDFSGNLYFTSSLCRLVLHHTHWSQLCIIFAKQIVLHKSIASALKHQHYWGKSTVYEKWELGTIAVHSDWECITSLWTWLCFAVYLQTKGHQAQNLLVDISKVSSWLKGRKSSASHLVCVFPLYLHASLFLFSFWSWQERECKDTATPEREDGLLLWLQPTGWALLGLNLSRMSVMLGSSAPGKIESRATASGEEPLMTGAVTGGDLSAFPACGSPFPGSPIKHRLCHVARAWPAKGGSGQTLVGWAELQILPVLCNGEESLQSTSSSHHSGRYGDAEQRLFVGDIGGWSPAWWR